MTGVIPEQFGVLYSWAYVVAGGLILPLAVIGIGIGIAKLIDIRKGKEGIK